MEISGQALFEKISAEVTTKTTGEDAPYNLPFAMSPGVCSTLTGLLAACLGVRTLENITPEQVEQIKTRHLLAAAYNALQGGVLAISGWDLVGALPVPADDVKDLMADNDARWINRGGYNLLGDDEGILASHCGIAKAKSLYGSLSEQAKDSNSFVSRLSSLLYQRKECNLSTATLLDVPQITNHGVLIMVNQIKDSKTGAQLAITAINFSNKLAHESVALKSDAKAADLVWCSHHGDQTRHLPVDSDQVSIALQPYQAQLILVSL